ncbi:hypothetical protein Bhyg_02451 [Pseudolycoriella hygida]|uniref:Uncharacterized protein n=1 Tax=Pseudolycoriella hygida TaxID=35572 RepID=A0A9Q0S8K1_9DIPT|nr:hypothetical protein Bhyg_02451 [Pseudolycoriella hygida]
MIKKDGDPFKVPRPHNKTSSSEFSEEMQKHIKIKAEEKNRLKKQIEEAIAKNNREKKRFSTAGSKNDQLKMEQETYVKMKHRFNDENRKELSKAIENITLKDEISENILETYSSHKEKLRRIVLEELTKVKNIPKTYTEEAVSAQYQEVRKKTEQIQLNIEKDIKAIAGLKIELMKDGMQRGMNITRYCYKKTWESLEKDFGKKTLG